jgi:hypothetical protein
MSLSVASVDMSPEMENYLFGLVEDDVGRVSALWRVALVVARDG